MYSQEDSDTDYLSYMLRLWRIRDGNGKEVWCASLEEPGSHQIQSFGDADGMFAFLQSQLGNERPGEHIQQEQQAQGTQKA